MSSCQNSVAKVTASLNDVKYKKDVSVYGQRFFRGPIRVMMKIKKYSKGKYEYKVNQKRYTVQYVEYVTFKGKEVKNFQISTTELMQGGELIFYIK